MSRRALIGLSAGLVLSSALLIADDMSIDFNRATDFAALKTFALGASAIESPRPELDNPLFIKMLSNAIRSVLLAKGLSEIDTAPHLIVSFRITGTDVSTTRRGSPILAGPGMRGTSSGPQSVRFTEGTLVIDLTKPGDPAPVWRGIYRDDERTGSKLVEKLPADAKKLLAKYPPK